MICIVFRCEIETILTGTSLIHIGVSGSRGSDQTEYVQQAVQLHRLWSHRDKNLHLSQRARADHINS